MRKKLKILSVGANIKAAHLRRGQNQSNDKTVQTERFSENQNENHSNENSFLLGICSYTYSREGQSHELNSFELPASPTTPIARPAAWIANYFG